LCFSPNKDPLIQVGTAEDVKVLQDDLHKLFD